MITPGGNLNRGVIWTVTPASHFQGKMTRLYFCTLLRGSVFDTYINPSKHKTLILYNICTTSAQRLRRWSNIVQMLYKWFFLFQTCRILRDRAMIWNSLSTQPRTTLLRKNLYCLECSCCGCTYHAFWTRCKYSSAGMLNIGLHSIRLVSLCFANKCGLTFLYKIANHRPTPGAEDLLLHYTGGRILMWPKELNHVLVISF